MGNTKYPSGIKVKAPLAWVGGAAIGISPILMFYYTGLVKEHYTGVIPRKTFGEDRYISLNFNTTDNIICGWSVPSGIPFRWGKYSANIPNINTVN